MIEKYDHKKIEKKWQDIWEKDNAYAADDKSNKTKYYCLDMFAYISGSGLHVGHPKSYTATDIISRYKRAKGYNVLHPVGWDAFGLPTENLAIKTKTHPKELTSKFISRFKKQVKSLGYSYDWSRELATCDSDYYRWTQWLFLQFYKNGLAYKRKAPVNWCTSCQTVLANEQVVDGKCERCKNTVIQKELSQWFFKITEYASPLFDELDQLDWPNSIKASQKNWIGKKEGIIIYYEIDKLDEKISIFTTRPDTNFGATFITVAPENEFVNKHLRDFHDQQTIKKYIDDSKKKTELERQLQSRKKTGVFTGLYAINQLNNRKMPIYISDFVLPHVGTGAVVGVPGHDIRDFEFAKAMDIEIIRVVIGSDGDSSPITRLEQVQEKNGKMINSDFLNGLDIHQATEEIIKYLEKKGFGKRTITYKLRDWLVSRQRYWGAPIPIIYCDKCGEVPVQEKDLPVLLPDDVDFQPTGESPLARSKAFNDVKCPKCSGKARRESDTMDTFVDSSWYFLRYTDSQDEKQAFDKNLVKKYLPVDLYIGGAEHAVLHLLYSRFVTRALKDLGYLEFDEPFLKLRNQGLILASDGRKMSKSYGNVVNPDEIIDKYGADALRMYEMFMGPLEDAAPWNTNGLIGIKRFLDRIWNLVSKFKEKHEPIGENSETKYTVETAATIVNVTNAIENMKFNTAISFLMELVNQAYQEGVDKEDIRDLLILLQPFAPHISFELWEKMEFDEDNKPLWDQEWPDPKQLKESSKSIIGVQINGKLRAQIKVDRNASQNDVLAIAQKEPNVRKYLLNEKPKKVIYIPSKILSIVI